MGEINYPVEPDILEQVFGSSSAETTNTSSYDVLPQPQIGPFLPEPMISTDENHLTEHDGWHDSRADNTGNLQ